MGGVTPVDWSLELANRGEQAWLPFQTGNMTPCARIIRIMFLSMREDKMFSMIGGRIDWLQFGGSSGAELVLCECQRIDNLMAERGAG